MEAVARVHWRTPSWLVPRGPHGPRAAYEHPGWFTTAYGTDEPGGAGE